MSCRANDTKIQFTLMRIHSLHHVPFEGLARIQDWVQQAGHRVSATALYESAALPGLDTFDCLIVMGGPMGANDDMRFAWMGPEKKLIGQAIAAGKKVLGVCLGAQLIADVGGARVYRNREKEIGWWPIEIDATNVGGHPLGILAPRATVFHWHGDTFDLPKGAVHLARSQGCENQAFAIGPNVVGLQFHIEVAAPQVEALIRHAASDLTVGVFVQTPAEMEHLSAAYAPLANAALFRFLDRFMANRG
jgi:GMP synthase-like glutamine amidotransferase